MIARHSREQLGRPRRTNRVTIRTCVWRRRSPRDLSGRRRPRSTGARVERQGPFEANKNEVGKQDVEYLVMLEETRESAGANDDGPFPVERPILNLLRQPADDGPVAEVQPRLDSFDRRST